MNRPASRARSVRDALTLLSAGEMRLEGRLVWSSNATFLVAVSSGVNELQAIYKPRRGERPLWDFAAGTLYQREMAAFVVSEALGWGLVPPTVIRDGPLGEGAVQAFVPHDPEEHYLALVSPDAVAARRIAAFDVIANNADRKSGHVLLGDDGSLWAIDHGVCFAVEPKLRTVIWEFAGEPLPADVRADLASLASALRTNADDLRVRLEALLSADEVDALEGRATDLVADGRFPLADPSRRAIPWPPV